VPEATEAEFNEAVDAASKAFKTWKTTSVLTRQRYMQDYVKLLKENHKKLAEIITRGIQGLSRERQDHRRRHG
jgi:malonate-semialdehyde dehydrogenase (acetylating)/methylmalonate-semialdehyde dehydrogenase